MLPIIRLTLTVEQQQDLRLPDHAGSMLRGAFGVALRKLACITRQRDCKSCPLYRSCAYPAIFETPAPTSDNPLVRQTVNPYIIQVPAMGSRLVKAGECWQFGFNLVGKAIDQLPLAVYAWQRACENGLSKSQSQATLKAIHQGTHLAYQPGAALDIHPQPLAIPALGELTRLRFVTPLRLQHEGRIVLRREQLDAPLLLMSLARRIQKLLDLHSQDKPRLNLAVLKEQAHALTLEVQDIQRMDVRRYSSRQQQLVELDGIIGEVLLLGDPGDFAPLLALGESVHVGKNATHGLGQYRVNA